MAVMHEVTTGMGGIRTAGDLVARMQMLKGMKLKDAKEYVAGKLGVDLFDLSDSYVMKELREQLDIGTVLDRANASFGMEAKFNIARVLDIPINSVNKFKRKVGMV
ncbi:dimethylamine methyltransferase [Candidatus Formimonas warabiya]|uniref:Dimethylamine methyltransferase n=1 Tax=Formimonas warabiya TaxID=1761012 RepID=A0A3G1KXT2_FORW1|nr:dimethylamine methyltransferase [Candidatus Formimonas warabiya]